MNPPDDDSPAAAAIRAPNDDTTEAVQAETPTTAPTTQDEKMRAKNPLGYSVTPPTQEEVTEADEAEEAEKGHS